MLEHASDLQKAEVRSSFLSLSVRLSALLNRSIHNNVLLFCLLSLPSMISNQTVKMHYVYLCTLRACPIVQVLTKQRLIDDGCLHLLVSFLGRVVQIDPMKPKLKPPGTNCLKLECDILLSTSAFKFYLRRYTLACTLRVHLL